jgi:hypothetical protein
MLSAVLIVVQAGPLWGCGNRSAGGSTAPSTAMAPSEFAGVYQHPAGSEEAEARLTITPSGMTISGSKWGWDSALTWSNGSGEPSAGWNFECAPESQEYCSRGSLIRNAQGVIATVSGGTRSVEDYKAAYGGLWVPVGGTGAQAAEVASTEVPEWLRGEWVCTTVLLGCDTLSATVRASSITEIRTPLSTRDCRARERQERTYQIPQGVLVGQNSYRVGLSQLDRDNHDVLVSRRPDRDAAHDFGSYLFDAGWCQRFKRP